MTLPRACMLSVLVHAFLFGTAIAVAGYTTGAFAFRQSPIIVSLVSAGGSRTAAVPQGTIRPAPVIASRTVERQESTPGPVPALQASEPGSAGQVRDIAAPAEGSEDGHAEARSVPGGAPGSDMRAGTGGGDQWAVITSAIERAKRYPGIARSRGIEGVARVRFIIARSGAVDRVEIVKSSGSEVLDNASVSTIYRAAPMPYVPGWVEVPIVYSLR